jgi:hypothetical protein
MEEEYRYKKEQEKLKKEFLEALKAKDADMLLKKRII